jgi:DNA polymerase-3 subunit epsilon
LDGRAVIDAMRIFHACERRDLSAAVQFYLGRNHGRAHSAAADVLATAEVLDAMLSRYPDLPRGATELSQRFKDTAALDVDGFFMRAEDGVRFARGKHRGQPLSAVVRADPDYLQWMLDADFFDDAKEMVRIALEACTSGSN